MGSNKIKIIIGKIEFEAESDSTEFLTKEREKFLEVIPNIMMNFPVATYNNSEENLNQTNNENIITNNLLAEKNENYSNLSTFLREKRFDKEVEITLAVIYYCQKNENIEYMSSNDVKEKLKSSKQKIPKNISQSFNNLASKGYIQLIEEKEKKGMFYYITDSGIDFINNYVKKETVKKVTKSKRKKVINVSRYEIKTREELNASNYPSFSGLSNKERIMLLMYILLKEENIIYTEIFELMNIMNDVFNIPLPHGIYKDTFRNNSKYFHKKDSENNKKAKEFKLIEDGIIFVEENIIEKDKK